MFLRVIKTRRQQIIPLSNTMTAILTEYLRYRKGNPEDYLFPTIQNKQLSPRGLETAIGEYNLRRGVTKKSVHLFWHTFARDWILAGGDEFTLQNLLGHTTSDMTKHYVNIYGKDLKNSQFYNLNPLDRRSTINSTITMKKGKKWFYSSKKQQLLSKRNCCFSLELDVITQTMRAYAIAHCLSNCK